jgi:hypothetical protein
MELTDTVHESSGYHRPMGIERKPDPSVDSGNDIEILRCVRGEETRRYRLRAVPGGAELWRITASDSGLQTVKESDFQSSEQVAGFLEELRRSLVAGGWREP